MLRGIARSLTRVGIVAALLTMVLGIVLARTAPADGAQRRPDNRVFFGGKYIYLNGINTPWNQYGQDFGGNYDPAYFETMFTQMQGYGVNSTRVWVHTDGRTSPLFDAHGNATGLPPLFYTHLDDYLKRAKAHNVGVILVLWAPEMDGRYNNGVDHTDLILDEGKTRTYIDKVLKPMVQRYRHHKAVLAWEIINEPDFLLPNEQAAGRTVVPKEALQRFIGRTSAAINRHSNQYVTVGAAMYKYQCDKIGNQPPNDAECYGNYWSNDKLRRVTHDNDAGLSLIQVHYYNWQAPYWFHWTPEGPHYYLKGDKPVIIGELGIDAQQGKAQAIADTYRVGYAGHFMWSYWYDPCCGGGWNDIKYDLKAFRDAHPNEVDINLNGSDVTPTPLPTDAPTAVPTATAVPSPTPVCTETGTQAIYADALDANWQNQSWDTSVSFANAAPVKSGSASVAITHTAGYAGFSLAARTPVPLSTGNKLRFWVHGGTTGGQTIWIKVNGNEEHVYELPAPAANAWTQVEVPLSFFGNPTQLSGLYLQNGTSSPQQPFYVDDFVIVQTSCS